MRARVCGLVLIAAAVAHGQETMIDPRAGRMIEATVVRGENGYWIEHAPQGDEPARARIRGGGNPSLAVLVGRKITVQAVFVFESRDDPLGREVPTAVLTWHEPLARQIKGRVDDRGSGKAVLLRGGPDEGLRLTGDPWLLQVAALQRQVVELDGYRFSDQTFVVSSIRATATKDYDVLGRQVDGRVGPVARVRTGDPVWFSLVGLLRGGETLLPLAAGNEGELVAIQRYPSGESPTQYIPYLHPLSALDVGTPSVVAALRAQLEPRPQAPPATASKRSMTQALAGSSPRPPD